MGGVACSNCINVLAKFSKSVSLIFAFRIEDCNEMVVNFTLGVVITVLTHIFP